MTFEHLFNFRDLGGPQTDDGGRVQPRRLYRSESVAYLSDADAARLVDEFGLATVVDLRGEKEVARWGRGPLGERPLRYIHVPIADVIRGLGNMSSYYVDMLTRRAADLVGLLRRLMEPGALPAVVHCEAGCDRTGVVTATVLGLLGVPDDEICADYAHTSVAVPAINARSRDIARKHGLPEPDGYSEETFMPTFEVMRETLKRMRDRWTDVAGWATAYGLTRQEIDALRTALVA